MLCKRSPSSSQGAILTAAKLGKGALWGGGQGLCSSSVLWPLAEVLRVRKGHWVTGLGPTMQRLTKEMDRASEGTWARCNATFEENTALPIPAQSGFSGTSQNLISAASTQPSLSCAGRAGTGATESVCRSPDQCSHLHGGRPASLTRGPHTAPALPTIFGFISGVTGAVGTLGHDRRQRQTRGTENSGLGDTGGRTRSLPRITCKHMPETQDILGL